MSVSLLRKKPGQFSGASNPYEPTIKLNKNFNLGEGWSRVSEFVFQYESPTTNNYPLLLLSPFSSGQFYSIVLDVEAHTGSNPRIAIRLGEETGDALILNGSLGITSFRMKCGYTTNNLRFTVNSSLTNTLFRVRIVAMENN